MSDADREIEFARTGRNWPWSNTTVTMTEEDIEELISHVMKTTRNPSIPHVIRKWFATKRDERRGNG